jgi:hypothetical protein
MSTESEELFDGRREVLIAANHYPASVRYELKDIYSFSIRVPRTVIFNGERNDFVEFYKKKHYQSFALQFLPLLGQEGVVISRKETSVKKPKPKPEPPYDFAEIIIIDFYIYERKA